LKKIADQRIMMPLIDESKRLDASFQKVKAVGMNKVMDGVEVASKITAESFGAIAGVVDGLTNKSKAIKALENVGAYDAAKILAEKDGDIFKALLTLSTTQALEAVEELGKEGVERINREMAQNLDFKPVMTAAKNAKISVPVTANFTGIGSGATQKINEEIGQNIDFSPMVEAANKAEINVPVNMVIGNLITEDVALLNSEVSRSNQAQEQQVFKIREQVENLIDKVMSPILSQLDKSREVNVRTTVEIDKSAIFTSLAGYIQDGTEIRFVTTGTDQ